MNLGLAPENGIKYAIYKDRVEFQRYTLKDLLKDEKLEENLIELHLFDKNKELRAIESNRGEIFTVIDGEDDVNRECYVEQVYTITGNDVSEQVEVVNYITFDENDIARIEDYRLREVKENENEGIC